MSILADAPRLETDRLVLRPPVPDDTGAWMAYHMSPRAKFTGGAKDAGRAWRICASVAGHWTLRGCGPFVVTLRDDGRPIGAVGPWFPADWPEREIGWSLWDAADAGEGYATEAAGAVLEHVFGTLGWETVVSYIDPANAPSIRLAERLGAVRDDAAPAPDATDLVYRHRTPS